MSEIHGVPSSNPGLATLEIPANGRKRKSPSRVAGALCNSASTAGSRIGLLLERRRGYTGSTEGLAAEMHYGLSGVHENKPLALRSD